MADDPAPREDAGERVRGLFERIAPRYDRINRILSLNLDRRWRRQAVARLELRTGDLVLDLCCGTGDFLAAIQASGAHAIGADFSPAMLARAGAKGHSRLVLADALALPFRSGTFDAATVGWGLRNVADLDLALAEVARVLRPGGGFVALDMALPAGGWRRSLARRVLGFAIPLVGAAVRRRAEYAYLPDSILAFPPPAELARRLQAAGFDHVRARTFGGGVIVRLSASKPS